MTLILIDTCKVTYRSKGPGVLIYCKLNILHILYIITHVTIIKHLLTYLLIQGVCYLKREFLI